MCRRRWPLDGTARRKCVAGVPRNDASAGGGTTFRSPRWCFPTRPGPATSVASLPERSWWVGRSLVDPGDVTSRGTLTTATAGVDRERAGERPHRARRDARKRRLVGVRRVRRAGGGCSVERCRPFDGCTALGQTADGAPSSWCFGHTTQMSRPWGCTRSASTGAAMISASGVDHTGGSKSRGARRSGWGDDRPESVWQHRGDVRWRGCHERTLR